MRASHLTVSSFALVATAAASLVWPAEAKEVPVVYRTDPGEAHPRYKPQTVEATASAPMQVVNQQRVHGTAAPGAISAAPAAMPLSDVRAYEVSASYSADPLYGTTSRGTITVQPGDTVYGIARRYGVPPAQLIATNRLAAPYKLSIGQGLIIPDAPGMITPAAPATATPVAFAAAASPTPLPSASRMYVVQQGDTVYGLSRRFGLDVATLAQANALYAPYNLTINQTLQIPTGSTSGAVAQGLPRAIAPTNDLVAPPAERLGVQPILVSKSPNARFAWPIRGALIREYGVGADGQRYDGISIAAPIGAPIRSADDGEVVYTGTELEGYGNLLLISHDDGWVSAYAHTDTILVKKGTRVRQGQVVAKVGDSGGVAQPQLHFELRHDLQPRDPLMALTGQDRLAMDSLR